MKTCWFVVIRANGSWWVDCEGRAFGPMSNREEAVQYARKFAVAYGDPERRSDVYVQEEKGRPVLIWSGPEPAR